MWKETITENYCHGWFSRFLIVRNIANLHAFIWTANLQYYERYSGKILTYFSAFIQSVKTSLADVKQI
jgi:hypothetical protein